MSIEERITAKQAEIMATLAGADDNKIKMASDLIKQAAFMAVTLEDLADVISEEGVTEEYTNGANQSGRKVSSNATMYKSLIGKYDAVISKLLKLVPEEKTAARPMPLISESRTRSNDAEIIERQRAKEAAFFDALKEGSVQQSDYHEFCNEWERQHAV